MSMLKVGSQGDETKKLQQSLKDMGYNIDVDGIFGPKTASVVKEYQTANGLVADGIVGDKTWTSLNSATQSASQQNDGYTKSADVLASEKAADDALSTYKNNSYTSEYTEDLNKTYNDILNRPDFSYDLGSDVMYQQYKDQYTQQGKQSMMDTMAETAALTGGYASSYSQNVGQQTYNSYMQQLNNVIPELYQLSLDRYNQQGEDLLGKYNLVKGADDTAYGRYSDNDAKLGSIYSVYSDKAKDTRDFENSSYIDLRNYKYTEKQDDIDNKLAQAEFEDSKKNVT